MESNTARPTILVVDDTPSNIKTLVEMLKEDYTVLVATTGIQAIQIARHEPVPDLILLDVMLPDMDGYEICRYLKNDEETKAIPIIFVTADHSLESEEKSFLVGAVDYVTKPLTISVVRARVRTHILLKQRTDMLERLALLDGLTNIANRRRFDEVLDLEWNRAQRKAMPLSLLILDVDNFKLFNDTYGHGAGDRCLRNIGRILEEIAARPGDLAARYGGEEFVVLLPLTPLEGANQVAERIRQRVSNSAADGGAGITAVRVTVSIGCASIIPAQNQTPDMLLKAADKMLYQAKRDGKNRIATISL